MGDIESKVNNLFRIIEDLRVKAERDTIRAETSIKFIQTLHNSIQAGTQPPIISPEISNEHFNTMMDYWKSLGAVIVKVSPKLEKEFEEAIVSLHKKWEKILKDYSKDYTEFINGNSSKLEEMLSTYSEEMGEYMLAFTALNSSVTISYRCITEMLDRIMDD